MSTRFRRPISRYFIILATRRGIKAANVLIKTKTVKLSDCTIWHETYMETAIRRERVARNIVCEDDQLFFFFPFRKWWKFRAKERKRWKNQISISTTHAHSFRFQPSANAPADIRPPASSCCPKRPRRDTTRSDPSNFFLFFFVLFWSVSLLGWPSHERVGKAYISRVGSVSQLSFNLNARAQKYPAKTRAALQERRRVWSARVDGQRSSSRQQSKLLSSAK